MMAAHPPWWSPRAVMDAANSRGPAWAPELRRQLQRLKQLEARERRTRRARWDVPLHTDAEPEGWLLSYLDLVTLMLVMLVVLLALARQSGAGQADTTVAATATVAQRSTDTVPAPSAAIPDTPIAVRVDADAAGPASTVLEAGPTSSVLPETMAPPQSLEELAHALAQAAREDEPVADGAPLYAERLTPLAALLDEDLALPPSPPVRLAGSLGSTAKAQAWPPFILPELQLPAIEAIAATAGPAAPAPSVPSLDALGLTELGDGVDVIVNEQSISLRISNEILFSSGQADLTAPGLAVLDRVAAALARNPYRISVEGHTDPIPIQTPRYPSNWELSTTRATSVLRQLEARGITASRLRATGYADTMPLTTNDTAEGRAINRRVEVILETVAEPRP